MRGQTPELDVVVLREQEYFDFSRSFQRDAGTPDGLIEVRTQVEVRACNPKCPE